MQPLPSPARSVCVQVRDNGIGFGPRAVRRSAHGLTGMRYRVQAAGGSMFVDASPGRGARLRIEPPGEAAAAG